MRYLLDADSSIDYLTGQAYTQTLFPQLLRDGSAVSGTTLIELLSGVYAGRNPREAERELRTFLGSVKVLPINRRVIVRTARLRATLLVAKAPVRHRAYDLITAATALVYDLTLVTSNTKDFGDIPGLTLLNPRTGASLTT